MMSLVVHRIVTNKSNKSISLREEEKPLASFFFFAFSMHKKEAHKGERERKKEEGHRACRSRVFFLMESSRMRTHIFFDITARTQT